MRKVFALLLIVSLLIPLASVTARPLADTYTSQPDGVAGMDTYLFTNQADVNFGTYNLFYIRAEHGSGSMTSLLKFDLSSIPANATINSATLTLTASSANSWNTDDSTVTLHRVKRAWTESGATWNTYNGTDAWATPGGLGVDDIDTSALSTLSFSAITEDTQKSFALDTAEVTKLIDGTNTNNGFLLMNTSAAEMGWAFYTSDDATATNRPSLVIDYSLFPATPIATPSIENIITYGDVAKISVNMLTLSVVTLTLLFFVVTTIIMRKRGGL